MKIKARHFSFLQPGFLMAGASRTASGAATDFPRKSGRWYIRPAGMAPLDAAWTAVAAPLPKSAVSGLPGKGAKKPKPRRAFTLIELLVVIAIIAILASILLPVLASARVRAQRAQCMNNVKQVAVGIFVFVADNNNTYPASGWERGDYQISWDSLIYGYIGGGNDPADSMDTGAYVNNPEDAATAGLAPGLKILACPLDTFPKVNYMTTPTGGQLVEAIKDYEMVSSGNKNTQGATGLVQRDPANGLPGVNTSGFMGVGIYWEDSSSLDRPNWNAPGFPDNVVRHPSGTIMLAEVASSMSAEGNIWPCCCCGPTVADGQANGWGNLYQIDTSAPQNPATLEGNGYNEGLMLYSAQRNRFNYAFHDGHVQALTLQQTTNNGNMWSVTTGN